MLQAEALARFVEGARFDDLTSSGLERMKIHILDSLACALGAVGTPLISELETLIDAFGGSLLCTRIGGDATSPAQAAFYNGALVRYLDFNDSFLAPQETPALSIETRQNIFEAVRDLENVRVRDFINLLSRGNLGMSRLPA